ncbi:sodium channel protein Nach [Augochlora pura]
MKYNYKPTVKDYLRSLRRRIKEFLLENSLHGIKYVMDIKRPKWERISWFILIMLSFVATGVTIFVIWKKFQAEPTITGLDIETDTKIDFPQILICFDSHQLNYMRIPQTERHIYEQVYNWTWGNHIDEYEPAYQTKSNFSDDFTTMAPNCSDVIFNCKYKGIEQPCSALFTKVIVAVGACCKLNAVQALEYSDANRDLEFETTNSYYPWRLYFHPNTDISPKRGERPLVIAYFPITLEFRVELTFTTSDIRYLTLRQRNCTYKQKGGSLDNCMMYHVTDQLLSRCNCVPWFLSFMKKKECPLSKYHCLNHFTVNPNDMDCWLLCDHTSYAVNAILKSSTYTNRISLKYWPHSFMKVEMRFGYLDLLVSFGGIASLFLGYSLLVSVEMGYYAALRSYCGAVIHISRQQYNITTIHVTEKVPNKLKLPQQYYEYIE